MPSFFFMDYQIKKTKIIGIIIAFFILSFLLFILDLGIGPSGIAPIDAFKGLLKIGSDTNVIIIRNIRLPRAMAALIAGFGLSMAGCMMQNVLKNPMASPSTLGVSQAAVFGANVAIIGMGAGQVVTSQGTSITVKNPYLVTIMAFVFAVASIFTVLSLSQKAKFSPETVVLCGVAIGFFFQASATILQFFAEDTQLSAAISWSFGHLSSATMQQDLLMIIVIGIAFVFFQLFSWHYNGMMAGNDVAKSLGIQVTLFRFLTLLFASLICAICVSFLGIIGFVGLIAPHFVKKLIGYDHRYIIVASGFCGSSLLLIADIVSRTILLGASLPVGAITSLLGAPAFLILMLRKKEGHSC